MALIIFDWNRTLYDVETRELFSGVPEMLEELQRRGYTLHLLSSRKDGRQDAIDNSLIAGYFTGKTIVEEKSKEVIEEIITSYGASVTRTYVVGDVRQAEVRFGKQAGARTIWLRKGEFAGLPRIFPEDEADMIILNIIEVLEKLE